MTNAASPDSASVLLFGGSFDPIHFGHLIVARSVAEQLGIPRIVLIPSARPPHKLDRVQTAPLIRVEMCRAAIEGDRLFEVSEWETQQTGPNYTLLTVRHFQGALPGTRIYWLIGMDSLNELHTWFHVGELVRECTLVTAARPGFEPQLSELSHAVDQKDLETLRSHVLCTPRIEISSTEIRRRVSAGNCARYLTPSSVCEIIRNRCLYSHAEQCSR